MDSVPGVLLDGFAVKEMRKPPKNLQNVESPPVPLDRGCVSRQRFLRTRKTRNYRNTRKGYLKIFRLFRFVRVFRVKKANDVHQNKKAGVPSRFSVILLRFRNDYLRVRFRTYINPTTPSAISAHVDGSGTPEPGSGAALIPTRYKPSAPPVNLNRLE